MEKKTKHKIAFFAIKYYPPLATVMMVIHVMLLLMGFNYRFTEHATILAVLPTMVLYCVEVAFDFCWIHRLCLLYVIGVSACMQIQKYIGFGSLLFPARVIVLIIGIVIIMLFLKRSHDCQVLCQFEDKIK